MSEPEKHRVGSRYWLSSSLLGTDDKEALKLVEQSNYEEYLLAQVSSGEYALISLRNGNRWHNSTAFRRIEGSFVVLSAEEFRLVSANAWWKRIPAV